MKTPPFVRTERLVLRACTSVDIPIVQRLASDPAVAGACRHLPRPFEVGAAAAWIAAHLPALERGKEINLAITYDTCGCLLGAISMLDVRSATGEAELACWVGRPYWNHGYGTEAAVGMIRYGFESLGLRRIHACHAARHRAAGRVLIKAGMRRVARSDQPVTGNGDDEHLDCYECYADAWRRR